jgi:hypothetical protein
MLDCGMPSSSRPMSWPPVTIEIERRHSHTSWTPRHFHTTIRSAPALTFMGACYVVVPRLLDRRLELGPYGLVEPNTCEIRSADTAKAEDRRRSGEVPQH